MTTIVELNEYNLADVRDIFNPSTFHPPGIVIYLIKTKIPHASITAFGNEYQFGRTGILSERDPVSVSKMSMAISNINKRFSSTGNQTNQNRNSWIFNENQRRI
jgi:hypothetical protein